MKSAVGVVAVWGLLVTPAIGGTLSAAEVRALQAEIVALTAAYQQGDAAKILDRTHPSLESFSGGRDALVAATRQAFAQTERIQMKFLSTDVGDPTQTYRAGDEEVCFVPTATLFEVQGRMGSSISFMVAIRPIGGGKWKFIDGSGFSKRPELLYQLLPKLEPGIQLPPTSTAFL